MMLGHNAVWRFLVYEHWRYVTGCKYNRFSGDDNYHDSVITKDSKVMVHMDDILDKENDHHCKEKILQHNIKKLIKLLKCTNSQSNLPFFVLNSEIPWLLISVSPNQRNPIPDSPWKIGSCPQQKVRVDWDVTGSYPWPGTAIILLIILIINHTTRAPRISAATYNTDQEKKIE